MAEKRCILVCSHLSSEVAAAISPEERAEIAVSVFPGCGTQQPTRDELVKMATSCAREFGAVLLIGGCCTTGLQELPAGSELSDASPTARCFDLIAGKALTDFYVEQGAYLVTGGWLKCWRQHIDFLGFDQATARDFFRESASRIVLFDTGLYQRSREHLREFADFVGLTHEALPVGLDLLRLFLNGKLREWRLEGASESSTGALARQQAADCMMAFELLSTMTRTRTETEAVQQMLELFTGLFQPKKLAYSPIAAERIGPPLAASAPTGAGAGEALLSSPDTPYAWTPSDTGFILRVGEPDDILGLLEVDDFAFPQHKAHYLNLALVLVKVCAMAISNARAYEELQNYRDHLERMVEIRTAELRQANEVLAQKVLEQQRAEDELRTLSRQLFEVQENERRAIARELHDQVGQDLTILTLLIDRLKRMPGTDAAAEVVQAQKETVVNVVGRVRNLSLSLRPGMLDDLGLLATLQWYLPDFSKKAGIQIDFQHYGMDREFPPDIRTAAYRAIQEALTNVLRYAQTDKATVIARADTTALALEVKDDGVGFDPAAVSASSSGLRGIRERIRPFGGKMAVNSAPGQGTHLIIELPIPPAG
ncbi:MAG: DUF1638 domain-containing protein [Chloroflexi bacterium]|nr:DUF1638 domain-containing protein [Chloroflexota bacterium]